MKTPFRHEILMDSAELRAALHQRAATGWQTLLLLGASLVAFIVAEGASLGPLDAALLIGVLFVHEAGHWTAMRAFGYRDVRVFFIPFFGAAVSGTPSGVSQARRAMVLLLGPLPGILVALAISWLLQPTAYDLSGKIVITLTFVNGLNLLPFEPFDGGKLARIVVASRFRRLDVASLALGTLGCAYLAIKLGSWALGLVAYLSAIGIPRRFRAALAADALRASGAILPEKIEDASDQTLGRLLFLVSRVVSSPLGRAPSVAAIVTWSRDVYERARGDHPKLGASLLLGTSQLAGLGLAVAALFPLYVHRRDAIRPLTNEEASRSGRILVHYPDGFKVVATSDAESAKIERVIDGAKESVLWTTIPAGDREPERLVEDVWHRIETDRPNMKIATTGGTCHRGAGVALELHETVDGTTGFQHVMCVYPVSDRSVIYEVTLPLRLDAAHRKVLLDIADAAEIIAR